MAEQVSLRVLRQALAFAGERRIGMALGYERDYFVSRQHGWTVSAAAVAERLLHLFPIRSVVEVGSGTGNMLAAFRARGVDDVLGLDGPNVPRDLMCIPAAQVRAWTLSQLAPLERRFDLACSLEVGEHVPTEAAGDFVRMLVAAAPLAMFGAAIPGQGGPAHINEQRQSWWAARFERHGYVPVDCIRPAVWNVPDIEWYYAQNILVYCRQEDVPSGYAAVVNPLYLDLVDTRVLAPLLRGPDSIKGAVAALRRHTGALSWAVARRFGLRNGAAAPAHEPGG
jgi:SAM-dependent methyltransferase